MHGYFLDTTKAFDRIDYSLFCRSGENPLILVYGSTGQCALEWISWFSISNGVRQGGVLSPILFTICIDDLLIELERQGIGCFWRHS